MDLDLPPESVEQRPHRSGIVGGFHDPMVAAVLKGSADHRRALAVHELLSDVVEVRVGDARQTLRGFADPVDLLFWTVRTICTWICCGR